MTGYHGDLQEDQHMCLHASWYIPVTMTLQYAIASPTLPFRVTSRDIYRQSDDGAYQTHCVFFKESGTLLNQKLLNAGVYSYILLLAINTLIFEAWDQLAICPLDRTTRDWDQECSTC